VAAVSRGDSPATQRSATLADDAASVAGTPTRSDRAIAAPGLTAVSSSGADAPAALAGASAQRFDSPVGSLAAATYAAVDASASVVQVQVAAAIDSPAFAASLASQVSVLTRDGIERAEIRLNPAEMGPVQVRIQVDGRDAKVEFSADLSSTRQVLEASLPQLAGSLREAGFTLSGGGVFQQAPEHRGASGGAGEPSTQGQPDARSDTPSEGRSDARSEGRSTSSTTGSRGSRDEGPAAATRARTAGSGRGRGLDLYA
jgi:flagellar hook-length control protein FliK